MGARPWSETPRLAGNRPDRAWRGRVMTARTAADLKGLRAARWTRESRPGQLDNSGPAAQAYEQDEAIEKLGLTDTGLAWEAGHSGWKQSAIATSEKWADMLERA